MVKFNVHLRAATAREWVTEEEPVPWQSRLVIPHFRSHAEAVSGSATQYLFIGFVVEADEQGGSDLGRGCPQVPGGAE